MALGMDDWHGSQLHLFICEANKIINYYLMLIPVYTIMYYTMSHEL